MIYLDGRSDLSNKPTFLEDNSRASKRWKEGFSQALGFWVRLVLEEVEHLGRELRNISREGEGRWAFNIVRLTVGLPREVGFISLIGFCQFLQI